MAPAAQALPIGKTVGATINTMRILQHLSRSEQPIGVSAMARATGIAASTCFNILRTLATEGYVRFLPDSKTYILGDALLTLASSAARRDYLTAVQPAMERIARAFGVTVTIWRRLSLNRMILIASADSRSALRIQMNAGHRLPLLIGGMGRILALQAGLSDQERRAMFAQLRLHRPLDYDDFIAQAEHALERGWGHDDGYSNAGVTALSVPVRFDEQPVSLVCSATMFRGQHTPDELERIAAELVGLATDLRHLVPPSQEPQRFT